MLFENMCLVWIKMIVICSKSTIIYWWCQKWHCACDGCCILTNNYHLGHQCASILSSNSKPQTDNKNIIYQLYWLWISRFGTDIWYIIHSIGYLLWILFLHSAGTPYIYGIQYMMVTLDSCEFGNVDCGGNAVPYV